MAVFVVLRNVDIVVGFDHYCLTSSVQVAHSAEHSTFDHNVMGLAARVARLDVMQ